MSVQGSAASKLRVLMENGMPTNRNVLFWRVKEWASIDAVNTLRLFLLILTNCMLLRSGMAVVLL